MNIALIGADGRMGRSLQSVHGEFGVMLTPIEQGDLLNGEELDAIIDFTTPDVCVEYATIANELGVPFVTGTTGLSVVQQDVIEEVAETIAVVQASNFSVGVNVLARLVEDAARAAEGFDLEVFEAHHKNKVDAPSGTALTLGRAAASGRGVELDDVAVWSREGHTGARPDDAIGFQVVRGGSVVGTHTVFLLGNGEQIELTHRATEREIFARGAFKAARWIVGRSAGLYGMRDVLFS